MRLNHRDFRRVPTLAYYTNNEESQEVKGDNQALHVREEKGV